MKIVLINPNNISAKNDFLIQNFIGTVPPYNLTQLASVIRKSGHETIIIDQYIEYKTPSAILQRLVRLKPDIIGISVLAPAFGWVRHLCLEIRLRLPSVKIVLGNSFAALFSQNILQDKLADAVVQGEGEETFDEYIKAIASKQDLREVAGLSFRQEGRIVRNKPRPVIADLDSLPRPAWDLIDLRRYSRIPMLALYGPVLMVQGSRGCSYNCFYCSQDADFKKMRKRSITGIVNELEFLYERYKVRNYIFLDAYFPFSLSSGFEFCDELIKRGLHKKIRWLTETKVDLVNRDLLKRMKEAGLYLIMYGFETGSERILRMINKHTTLERAYCVMRDTRDIGIRSLGLFMLGFPGETEEECQQTIVFSKRLSCDLVKYNLLTPYPGTGLYQEYIKNKMLAYERPELFTSWFAIAGRKQAPFNFTSMSTSTLLSFQRKALISYYLRPQAMFNILSKRIVKLDSVCAAAPFLFLNYLLFIVSLLLSKTTPKQNNAVNG